MARRISDEEIKLTIIINGNEAQKEILDLEKANIRLRAELKEQEAQRKKLERQKKTETEDYKALTQAISANTKILDTNEAKIKKLTAEISLTDKSMTQLRRDAQVLNATLAHLVPGTADFDKYKAKLDEVNARMDELKGKGKEASWSLGGMADKFNRYAAMFASVFAIITGVVFSIQKTIDANGKLSDSMTDVQKTTGMTKKEVDDLARSFGMLKTRTGRIELLNIAKIGGELGVAKAEIGDFVTVMNKSSVALGDAFQGGPEVVAEKLGRIKGLYEELKNAGIEESFEAVGSALNELGADGTASAQNVAEFTQIVGTIPGKLKPTIQQALGLGAAFEESGLMADIAGNNYSKFVSIASRDIDKFAKVMQRPVAEMKALINTNPAEFFLQFAQSLKGLDPTDLSKILDYLKLNDQQVKQILGAASDNVQLFRDKILLANDSMAEATSLTDEYNLKNNNLAANLERLKKVVMGWFTSDSVVAFLESAVSWLAKFVGAVEDSDGTVSSWRTGIVNIAKVLAILIASMISYNAVVQLCALWTNSAAVSTALLNVATKAEMVVNALAKASLVARIAVMKLFGMATDEASAKLARLNHISKASVWGAIIAVVVAAAAAYMAFKESAEKATEAQIAFNAIQAKVVIGIKEEKLRIDQLLAVAKDEKVARDTRLQAIKDLIAISPKYLQGLSLETINTNAATEAINAYIKALDRKLEAEEIDNQIRESKGRIQDIYRKDTEEFKQWYDGMFSSDTEGERNKTAARRIEAAVKNEEELQKQLYERRKQLYIDSAGEIGGGDTTGTAIAPGDEDKGAERRATRERKIRYDAMQKALEDAKKAGEDLTDLERQAIDARLALITDGFDKEEALENENHRRKLEDLRKQLVSEEEITKLDTKIADSSLSPMERGAYMHIKQQWQEKNAHINSLIETEESRHTLALDTIYQKAENKRLDDLQSDFDRETKLRQAAHNEELASLGNNETAKQKLQDEFDQDEYDRHIAHLRALLAEQEKILADENGKIDFDLLTDEQKKSIEDDIAELKLKISEALKAKQELQGKKGSDDLQQAMGNVFGGSDVLGFTADQWGQTFSQLDTLEQKLSAAKMVVGAIQSAWSTYNDYLNASEDASLAKYESNSSAKQRKLKWQLDNGYINQMQYKRGLEAIDADLEKKKAEIAYKQAKRQRAMSAAAVIINTAQAIMGIWAQFPKADFGITAAIMSGVVGALGAVQLATVLKTPLPAKGYEKGLYPDYVKREQDGKMFRANYGGPTRSGMVNKPTYFLAGENGPELVIDNDAYRKMSPDTKALLARELRGIKGWEKGLYNNDVKGGSRFEVPAENGNMTSGDALAIIQANAAAMNRMADVMEKISDDGILAYMSRDGRELKKLQEEMDRVNNTRKKAQS